MPRSSRHLWLLGIAVMLGLLIALALWVHRPPAGDRVPETRRLSKGTRLPPPPPPASSPPEREPVPDAVLSTAEEEQSEQRTSRGEQYTAAFNRKISRWKQRIGSDCEGQVFMEQAFVEVELVRDRIIESAVATDQGMKTKREQRDFENKTLEEYNTWLCRSLEQSNAPQACTRHFKACKGVLSGHTHW